MSWHYELPVAINEWIPDDEPDLDWFNRPRNPLEPDTHCSTKLQHGKPQKSIWMTVASWFSNPPEKGARASRLFSDPKHRR